MLNTIMLPGIIEKLKVYQGSLNNNLKFFIESPEKVSGGMDTKSILKNHTDYIHDYSDSTSRFKLSITQRPVENGDQFIFLNLTNFTESNKIIKFSMVFNDVSNQTVYDLNKYYQEPERSDRYGNNKLTTPSRYIEMDIGSMLMSKSILYKDNNLYYASSAKSLTRKIYSELDESKVYSKGKSIHIETIIRLPAGVKSDFFVLISEKKLFNSFENLNHFFLDYKLSVENNDIRYNMWVTPQGSYTKLPYSIEPFDQDAYGINLHHMSKKEMVRYFRDTKDRFYFNMIYNAVIQLFGYRPQQKGLFLTDYTSTWLKKDYDITAPYIDTRLNETVSLMINDVKNILPFPGLADYDMQYANFLVEYLNRGIDLIRVSADSYYFPDYFPVDQVSKIAHSSLNHQLGILNYILNKYKITKNKDYEGVSKGLLLAIKNTQNDWIKENGDLYYKISSKEGELCFSETDYIYVTLIDLLLVQESLIEIYNNKDSAIDVLIISKLHFLNNNQYGLNDENALLPANEDISSRNMAKKLAKKLNYI